MYRIFLSHLVHLKPNNALHISLDFLSNIECVLRIRCVYESTTNIPPKRGRGEVRYVKGQCYLRM